MLPAYCRSFDVGIIPFRIDALTVRANPLKLREYLAAGLPVVSSDLPEVRKYAGVTRLATGPEGFISAIEASLAERDETAARARMAAVAGESWEARVEQISELIDDVGVRR
jgi:glycosyltransferase involved in cell wall biosynthesis